MTQAGRSQDQIGTEIGRTKSAVSVMQAKWGLNPGREAAPKWSDDKVDRIKAMWARGDSLSAIGRAVKMSRNAIGGKVHRLGLPARPSPIKRRKS